MSVKEYWSLPSGCCKMDFKMRLVLGSMMWGHHKGPSWWNKNHLIWRPHVRPPSTLRWRNLKTVTLKTRQIVSVHTTPKTFKTQQSWVISELSLRKTRVGNSPNYRDRIVSEKLRFRDGLVCTEGLTVEIKLYFQISPAQCGRGPRYLEIFQKYKGKFTRV